MNNIPNYKLNSADDLFNTLNQFLDTYFKNNIDTITIAEVVNYNNNMVNVLIELEDITTVGQIIKNTTLYNIPVMMLFGGGCQISFPLQAGDKGILLACKSDISKYKINKQISTKASQRQFSFSDALFIPLNFNNVESGIILKNKNSIINIKDSEITINSANINITAESVINGNLTVNGTITATGTITGSDCLSGAISGLSHLHPFIGVAPAITSTTQQPQ